MEIKAWDEKVEGVSLKYNQVWQMPFLESIQLGIKLKI